MCELEEYQKIIDTLRGSALSLTSYLSELGREELADVVSFTDLLDSQIFLCPACGWWCPQEESQPCDSGEDECSDCAYGI